MANKASDRVYVALTTTGESGWYVQLVGEPGESKHNVYDRAREEISDEDPSPVLSIYQDTELKNLVVLSRSAARRSFSKAMSWHEYGEDHGLL